MKMLLAAFGMLLLGATAWFARRAGDGRYPRFSRLGLSFATLSAMLAGFAAWFAALGPSAMVRLQFFGALFIAGAALVAFIVSRLELGPSDKA